MANGYKTDKRMENIKMMTKGDGQSPAFFF